MAISNHQEEIPTAALWVWVVLTLIACASFWCQATVTEERFVPALNYIATVFNIPDDIAGATLMAAGASSPELFSSIVSLFVTHSSLGLGTVVGSEIFNQLIICSGATYAARSGALQLDPAIVTREVSFYALSIGLLYWALRDTRPDPSDAADPGVNHIYINFFESVLVFSGYIAYVVVCANMDSIVKFCAANLCRGGKPARSDDADKSAGTSADAAAGAGGGAAGGAPAGGRGEKMKLIGTYGSVQTGVNLVKDDGIEQDMPFLREKGISNEPRGNFKYVSYFTTVTGQQKQAGEPTANVILETTGNPEDAPNTGAGGENASLLSAGGSDRLSGNRKENSGLVSGSVNLSRRSLLDKLSVRFFSDGNSLRRFDFLIDSQRPGDEHGLYDMEINAFEDRLSCFMWQRSYFYSKAKFATNGWNLRWFTMTPSKMVSVPNRFDAFRRRNVYPRFVKLQVDEHRNIIKIINPTPGKRDFYLMAPSDTILHAVLDKMEQIIRENEKRSVDAGDGKRDPVTDRESSPPSPADYDDDAKELIDFPVGGSNAEVFFFIVLYPLRFLLHHTVPDVRALDDEGNPVASLPKAFLAISSCLLWLIVGSYAMVSSLESLAALMNIPDAVVGVTVSAAGTSLPNYVASKVAAQNGFGNMAVSNAFGSNTFNIMIGLGLPWTLYTSFGTGFEPYHGLRDEGITQSVLILATVLLVFVVLVLRSGFVLYRWHAALFIAMYVAYLAFAIGQVYW